MNKGKLGFPQGITKEKLHILNTFESKKETCSYGGALVIYSGAILMLPHWTIGKIKALSGPVEKIPKGITENSPQIYQSHQEKWFSDPPIRKNVYNTLFPSESWILI